MAATGSEPSIGTTVPTDEAPTKLEDDSGSLVAAAELKYAEFEASKDGPTRITLLTEVAGLFTRAAQEDRAASARSLLEDIRNALKDGERALAAAARATSRDAGLRHINTAKRQFEAAGAIEMLEVVNAARDALPPPGAAGRGRGRGRGRGVSREVERLRADVRGWVHMPRYDRDRYSTSSGGGSSDEWTSESSDSEYGYDRYGSSWE